MTPRFVPLFAAFAIIAIGCTPENVSAPVASSGTETAVVDMAAPGIVAMNQNLYVGADVDLIIAALASPDPTDDLPTLLAEIAILQRTDFPTRAAAIATQIAERRPHVVGLQEVSGIHVDLTAFGIPVTYDMEFLPVLMGALEARGLHYQVAAQNQNFIVAPLPGVSLTDYDVLLYDSRRVVVGEGARGGTYHTNVGTVAPGVTITRGWVGAPITVEGRRFRVVSTHLESDLAGNPLSLLRAAQMQELLAIIGPESRTILLGDLNDFQGSPMYQLAQAAGFQDGWMTLRHGENTGFTCCHDADLSNEAPGFNQRIDYVLTRGFGRERMNGAIQRIFVRVPGPVYPIWQSDHAGVIARLEYPRREEQ